MRDIMYNLMDFADEVSADPNLKQHEKMALGYLYESVIGDMAGLIFRSGVDANEIKISDPELYELLLLGIAYSGGSGGGKKLKEKHQSKNTVDKTSQIATIDDLISSSTKGSATNGRTTQYVKSGGVSQANSDFDALNLSDIKPISGGRVGKLPDGRTVVVRNASSGGPPTLEVQDGKKGKNKVLTHSRSQGSRFLE